MQYIISRTSRQGNRESNQDRIAAIEKEQSVLLVLGDGLGGKRGGALAAQTLIDTATENFAKEPVPVANPQEFLENLLHKAHQAVISVGMEHQPPLNPGTTAVLCLVQNGSAWWAHVGDSRLYLFRNGVPLYRTQDHSYVENLYQQGEIPLEHVQGHPMRNFVTRCIGYMAGEPEVSLSKEIPLLDGDILLLCSDGLWEPLDDAQLGAVLMEGRLADALNKLAENAEQASYPNSDNTSAVAMQIMSLQLLGQAQQATRIEHREEAQNTSLEGAIDEIERAIRQYEHEMKD